MAGGESSSSPALAASLLVAKLADLLEVNIRSHQPTDSSQLSDLCISLARVIDYAVACNEVPSRAQTLPLLIRQVCNHSDALSIQAAVMVLMISVKDACTTGWFPDKDRSHLLALANEVGKSFSNSEDVNTEPSCASPNISTIMNRFYPKIKMSHVLVSLTVKPGYRAVVADFSILNKTVASAQEEIGLFVAQIDNTNTSSCIVTPPQANFLLNGKGVQGRINVSMDTGPQLPTNITAMLNCGTNVLQAVGQFDGAYIIVIAYMHEMSSSDTPVLQDYVQPVASYDSSSDVIEKPSQVSLNCPISNRRIRTPVKGHSCKHYQCFDYESFMIVNSRRPLWCCPLCNQSVCHVDLRIDHNIAKVLREVGESAMDVIVSANGSWKVVFDSDDNTDQTYHRAQGCQGERPEQRDFSGFSSVAVDVIDLTMEEDNTSHAIGIAESEGREHDQDNLLHIPVAENLVASEANNPSSALQNAPVQVGNNIYSGILPSMLSTPFGSTAPATNTVGCTTAGISEFPRFTFTPSAHSNVISPVLNQESVAINGLNQVPPSLPHNQVLDNNYLHQFRVNSSVANNECGRNAYGVSTATQAFPTQFQYPRPSEQIRNLNSSMPNGTSFASYLSMLQFLNSPIRGARPSSNSYRPPLQYQPPQDINSPNMGTTQAAFPSQNTFQAPQRPNFSCMRTTQAATPSQNMVQTVFSAQATQFQQRRTANQVTDIINNSQPQLRTATQPVSQMTREPPFVAVQLQPSGTRSLSSNAMVAQHHRTTFKQRSEAGIAQPISVAETSATVASTENWQPTGRTRGSLTGEAYAAALKRFMTPPAQPAQTSQNPSNLTTSPHSALQMHGLTVNSTKVHVNSQAQTHPSAVHQPGSSNTPL